MVRLAGKGVMVLASPLKQAHFELCCPGILRVADIAVKLRMRPPRLQVGNQQPAELPCERRV